MSAKAEVKNLVEHKLSSEQIGQRANSLLNVATKKLGLWGINVSLDRIARGREGEQIERVVLHKSTGLQETTYMEIYKPHYMARVYPIQELGAHLRPEPEISIKFAVGENKHSFENSEEAYHAIKGAIEALR